MLHLHAANAIGVGALRGCARLLDALINFFLTETRQMCYFSNFHIHNRWMREALGQVLKYDVIYETQPTQYRGEVTTHSKIPLSLTLCTPKYCGRNSFRRQTF